jgi:hypothetical protein
MTSVSQRVSESLSEVLTYVPETLAHASELYETSSEGFPTH